MEIVLNKMSIQDLNNIKDSLYDDFDDYWSFDIFGKELNNPNSLYIIAKHNNDIVGFGGIWNSVDQMHITNIVTKKNCRKLGIANKILEKLIDISKKENFSSITLEVNCNNYSAIQLYKKHNFKHIGTRPKYYNHTDNAFIMTLLL